MLPEEPRTHKPATNPTRELHKNPRPDAIPVTRWLTTPRAVRLRERWRLRRHDGSGHLPQHSIDADRCTPRAGDAHCTKTGPRPRKNCLLRQRPNAWAKRQHQSRSDWSVRL